MMQVREEIEEYELGHDLEVKASVHREVKNYSVQAVRNYDFRNARLTTGRIDELDEKKLIAKHFLSKADPANNRQQYQHDENPMLKWPQLTQKSKQHAQNRVLGLKMTFLMVLLCLMLVWTIVEQWPFLSTFLGIPSTGSNSEASL